MNTDLGGIHARRGYEFQTASLLYYLLARTIGGKPVEAILEQGQDATFVYPASDGRSEIVELVQCKKGEARPAGARTARLGADPWFRGMIRVGKFESWLRKRAGRLPTWQMLTPESRRYTVLAYGTPEPKLLKYIPDASAGRAEASEPAVLFEPDFEHRHAFADQRVFPPAVLKRTRLLLLPKPDDLAIYCCNILMNHFDVKTSLVIDLVDDLLQRFDRLQSAVDTVNRSFGSNELMQFIAPAKFGSGEWRQILRDGPKGSAPEGIWKSKYFDASLSRLFNHGTVVLCGASGSGKTTLVGYLIDKFHAKYPGSEIFYLAVKPAASLEEEAHFFARVGKLRALFVIDDEHYSQPAVERLVEKYDKDGASLIVTSTSTYSETLAGPQNNRLNSLQPLRLDDLSKAEIEILLEAQLPSVPSLAPEQRRIVAEWAGGKIGFALALARCIDAGLRSDPGDAALTSDNARRVVARWVRNALRLPDSDPRFESEAVPVLLLASYGLPIPESYADILPAMHWSGILGEDTSVHSKEKQYIAADLSIPIIISLQYRRHTLRIIGDFVRRYPKLLPAVCLQLTTDTVGRNVLRNLVKHRMSYFVERIYLHLEDIAGLNTIVSSIWRADKDLARHLLRDIAAPYGHLNLTFAYGLFRPGVLINLREYSRLLAGLRHIDRFVIKRIFANFVDDDGGLTPDGSNVIESFISVLAGSEYEIDAILSFAHVLRTCHHTFGENLFGRMKDTGMYNRKIQRLREMENPVSPAARCASVLRELEHIEFKAVVDEFLNFERVAAALDGPTTAQERLYLIQLLQRAHPKLAMNIVRRMVDERPTWLASLMSRSDNVVHASNLLRALSRTDRRSAVLLGWSQQQRLLELMHRETDQYQLAWVLDALCNMSYSLVSKLSAHIDWRLPLKQFQEEPERVMLVGRALFSYAHWCPSLGADVLAGLDYMVLYRRIPPRRFLTPFTWLTRGLLAATAAGLATRGLQPSSISDTPSFKRALIEKILDEPDVAYRLRSALAEPGGLSEIAFAISGLREVGLSADEIFLLFGIENHAAFFAQVRTWAGTYSDLAGYCDLLYSAVSLGVTCARHVLEIVTECILNRQVDCEKDGAPNGSKWRKTNFRGIMPQGIDVSDVAAIGAFLRISGAIEGGISPKSGTIINLPKLCDYCRNEYNLGRQVCLLYGLMEASRPSYLDIIKQLYGCEDQRELDRTFRELENVDDIIHLVRLLQRTTHSSAVRVANTAIGVCGERVIAHVDSEGNLAAASRWLRLAQLIDRQSFGAFVEAVVACMHDNLRYDNDFFGCIEAALATAELGRFHDAKIFVRGILASAERINSIKSATVFSRVVLQILRIEGELKLDGFSRSALSSLSGDTLIQLISADESVVWSAFIHYLAQHHVTAIYDMFGASMKLSRISLELRLRGSNIPFPVRLVSMILLGCPRPDVTALAMDTAAWAMLPWEIGLVELLAAAFYDDARPIFSDSAAFSGLAEAERDRLLAERATWFSADASSLKFALSLRSLPDLKLVGLSEHQIRHELQFRLADEPEAAVRCLLDVQRSPSELCRYPGYVRAILADSILRPFIYDWGDAVASAVWNAAFYSERRYNERQRLLSSEGG